MTIEDTQTKAMTPKRLRINIYWLALDWIHIKSNMPTPPKREGVRHSNTREYGHPAEWASDKSAEIADLLHSWHELLAEHRNETPPPSGSERTRLTAAYRYLEPRCEQLIELVGTEPLQEIPDLHHNIRRTLGMTKPRYTLPIPCPNIDCGLRTLTRIVGVGQDFIICDACGYTVRDDEKGDNYRWLVRVCLDALLDTPRS